MITLSGSGRLGPVSVIARSHFNLNGSVESRQAGEGNPERKYGAKLRP